ncbi:MAG TPA: DUF3080 family protein [Pseudidiomarina sp.]|nr:DUF3080 family protein [Pseudidiomarina sp.]
MIVTRTTRFGYAIGLLMLFFSLTLSGCSDEPPALKVLVDYRERVATPQNLELPALQIPAVTRPPEPRELRVEVPEVTVSLLDSLRLDTCAAGASIVQRNSALGRLENGFRRYHGDLEIVEQLSECLTSLDNPDSELGQRLQQALAAKRATLPLLKQRAIASDDALRHALTPANQSSADLSNESLAESLDAFQVLLNLLQYTEASNPSLVSADRLEQALETLEQSDALGFLWRNQHEWIYGLEQSHALVNGASARAGCMSAGTPQRAQILRTVFTKYFAAEVQTQVALLTGHAYRVGPLLTELQKHSNQALLVDYLAGLQDLSIELTAAIKTHAEHWQEFFRDCDFQPGSLS